MRKYRCNRILEDRKISRRLCAPFFFPPFVRERPRPVQGRTLPSSVSQPRLQKYLFRTRMIRGRIERARHANSIRAFVACSKKIHRKTIPKLFLVHYSSVKARKRALVHRAGEERDAISIHRAQSSHSPHDCPYCIGVRASAYINKRAPSVCWRSFSRCEVYIYIVLGDRPRELHRETWLVVFR